MLVDPASRLLRAGLCARISDRTPQALSQREDDCCLSLLCISVYIYIYLVGGFNPYEKYESQLGLLFPIYGKLKNVPHHQPYIYI